MNIIDLLLISGPEIITVLYFINNMLNVELTLKKYVQMSLIWLISCFIIRNTLDIAISVVLLQVIIIILIWSYMKVSFISSLIAAILSFFAKFISELIVITSFNLMGLNLNKILENPTLKIFTSYITLVLMIVIIKGIKNIRFYTDIKKNLDGINISRYKVTNILIVIVSILMIFIFAIVVMFFYINENHHYGVNEILMVFTIISCILAISSLILGIITSNKRRILTEIENSAMRTNLEQMEYSIDALNIQRHDYMNHLQVILMQVSKGKNEDARKYILSMCKDQNSDATTYNTGCTYLDAVLNLKKRRASKYDIELTACVDSLLENVELSESELSSIFLNLIDNAIEELKNINQDYKYVHVDIYEEGSFYYISIKNTGSKIKDVKKIFEMGYSSKGENRGYGLYAIKRMLQSYNCTIKVESDEEETEFIIELPMCVKNN